MSAIMQSINKHFVVVMVAAAASVAAFESAADGANIRITTVSSPDIDADATLVRDWLEHETRKARRSMRPASNESAEPAAPSVELVAIYGVGRDLGAELRIGGVRHVLVPEAGAGRATDRRGADSLVAERIAGPCLSLRYRRTVRRLCLPAVGESVAHRVSSTAEHRASTPASLPSAAAPVPSLSSGLERDHG